MGGRGEVRPSVLHIACDTLYRQQLGQRRGLSRKAELTRWQAKNMLYAEAGCCTVCMRNNGSAGSGLLRLDKKEVVMAEVQMVETLRSMYSCD